MLDEAYALFADHYEDTDRDRFERDLGDKQLVVLLEDAEDRSLRGFSTVHLSDRRDVRGRRCTVVFSGDTVIHRSYWGQGQLQREYSRLLVRRKLRHPRRPLYWFLISKGFRTYLLLVNNARLAIPRHDSPVPPERLQRMLDLVASERFGSHYDPATGLVQWPAQDKHEHVRDGLADIPPGLAEHNPHVALFLARNPQFGRGDELACIADMTLWTMLRVTVKTVRRVLLVSRRRSRRRAPAASRSVDATAPGRGSAA